MNEKIPENFRKILITGGAGFIGGAVIRNLLKNSKAEIFNLDKLSYASDLKSIENTMKEINFNSQIKYKFLHVDLIKQNDVYEALKIADPDLVINLAAESQIGRAHV